MVDPRQPPNQLYMSFYRLYAPFKVYKCWYWRFLRRGTSQWASLLILFEQSSPSYWRDHKLFVLKLWQTRMDTNEAEVVQYGGTKIREAWATDDEENKYQWRCRSWIVRKSYIRKCRINIKYATSSPSDSTCENENHHVCPHRAPGRTHGEWNRNPNDGNTSWPEYNSYTEEGLKGWAVWSDHASVMNYVKPLFTP